MKRLITLVLGFLLLASVAHADYTTHVITFNDGKTISVKFQSAVIGEEPKTFDYPVSSTSTLVAFRTWVGQQFKDLNANLAISKLAAIQVGQVVVPIDPTVVLTAPEIAANAWAAKISTLETNQAKLARITAMGLTPSGALQTAITALTTQIGTLRTEINSDYNAADAPTRTAMQGKL